MVVVQQMVLTRSPTPDRALCVSFVDQNPEFHARFLYLPLRVKFAHT
jgi:hypothetical protein